MFQGHTFGEKGRRFWYCSRRPYNCPAKVHLNFEESKIVFHSTEHNHEKPMYFISPEGIFIKTKHVEKAPKASFGF